jgi:hypothetical protein
MRIKLSADRRAGLLRAIKEYVALNPVPPSSPVARR